MDITEFFATRYVGVYVILVNPHNYDEPLIVHVYRDKHRLGICNEHGNGWIINVHDGTSYRVGTLTIAVKILATSR